MKSGPKIPAEYLSKDSELQQQPPRGGDTVHYRVTGVMSVPLL